MGHCAYCDNVIVSYEDHEEWCAIMPYHKRVTELEAALAQIALAPFPLHDYCSPENWALACQVAHDVATRGDIPLPPR